MLPKWTRSARNCTHQAGLAKPNASDKKKIRTHRSARGPHRRRRTLFCSFFFPASTCGSVETFFSAGTFRGDVAVFEYCAPCCRIRSVGGRSGHVVAGENEARRLYRLGGGGGEYPRRRRVASTGPYLKMRSEFVKFFHPSSIWI